MKHYIILFKDGALMVCNHKPEKTCHQDGAKLFKTTGNPPIDIDHICVWLGQGYKHTRIKEIKW